MASDWSDGVLSVLKREDIRFIATVPDGGLTNLLQKCEGDPGIDVVTLTTEEEGVAFVAGAWLGGQKGALFMQSSGVGNCINMLSLPAISRIPCLMLVTMRGEWGEFNPWQNPMGRATEAVLAAMGTSIYRPASIDAIEDDFAAAARDVFNAGGAGAVLVGQRLLGSKKF